MELKRRYVNDHQEGFKVLIVPYGIETRQGGKRGWLSSTF